MEGENLLHDFMIFFNEFFVLLPTRMKAHSFSTIYINQSLKYLLLIFVQKIYGNEWWKTEYAFRGDERRQAYERKIKKSSRKLLVKLK